MDNVTDEQKKVIDELRRRTINDVTPKMLEDESLFYRFAKAREFNVVEAEAMLRKHLVWRKDFEMDTILTDYKPPEVCLKYGNSSFICHDKDGGAVRIQDWGRGDLRGFYNCVTKKEMAKYWFYLGEKDKAAILRRGGNFFKPVFVLIYDMEKQSYAEAVHVKVLQYLMYGVKMLIDNYPECVKSITVINAPFYFAWTYAVVKPVLPASVTQKTRIFGTDGWREALMKNIDPNDWPAYLGGNRTDPDGNPLCKTFIQFGRPVPKSYYKQSDKKRLCMASDAEKITVKPLSSEEITFEIKEENMYLEWEIEMKNRDIDFSLKFTGESLDSLDSEELMPKQRIDSSSEAENGCLRCEKAGKYTFVFDNSFSWIHTKEVYYRVRIRQLQTSEL